eukprot:gb/GECG01014396.1/.p1 GENE.gb/GECG01014396.1/~~gb/GECG01014396.1/.p1  ORF type:complete len:551 (+),score=78.76 gb/GECG01014396.1/:1-1653(+)
MAHFAAFRTASIKLRSVFNLAPQNGNSTQQQEHNRFTEGVERWARPSAGGQLTSSVSSSSGSPAQDTQERKDALQEEHHELRSKSVDDPATGAPVYADPAAYTESDELPTLANSTIDRCNRILQQSMDRWERAAVVHSGSPIDAGDELYETSPTYTRRQIAVPKRSPIRRTASVSLSKVSESEASTATTTQSRTVTEDSHSSNQVASSPRRELSSSFRSVAHSTGYTANSFSASTNFAKTIAIDITKVSSPTTNVAYAAVAAPDASAPEASLEADLQTDAEGEAIPREGETVSATEQYEKVASKKKKSSKDNKQKDMNVISDRVRRELIAPRKPVTAKIVKFSKNGFPVVRFTGQFSWIGLRAKVIADSDSTFEDYKVGQNVYVQITDIYRENESDSESYWLVDCKLREEEGVPAPAGNINKRQQQNVAQDKNQADGGQEGSSATRLKFGPTEKKETTQKSSTSRAALNPSASSFVPSDAPTASLNPSTPAAQMSQQQQQQQQGFFIGQPYYITPVYYVPMPQQQVPYPPPYSPSPYGYFTSVADQYGLR